MYGRRTCERIQFTESHIQGNYFIFTNFLEKYLDHFPELNRVIQLNKQLQRIAKKL